MPVPGEKPHARRIAAHQHSEAVVLDLVQPPPPQRADCRLGWAGKARRSRGRLRDATTWGINTSGPGRVESDLSTKTKTYFAFRVDVWDATGDNLIEHLAGVEDYAMAVAAYWAAIQNRPKDKITLRQGARVVMKNWTE